MKIKQITETTTSGAIATVNTALGSTQNRGNPSIYGGKKVGSLFKGKKTKAPYANSINESAELSEAELQEDDIIMVPGQGRKFKTGFIPHGTDRTDHEVEMAKSDLFQAAQNAQKVFAMIKDVSEEEGLEGWVQEKIIKANDYLNTIREYIEGKQLAQEETGGVVAGGGVGESYYGRMPGRTPAFPAKILSAKDQGGVITVMIQAHDGTRKVKSDTQLMPIITWLSRYGLELPPSITKNWVMDEGIEDSPVANAIINYIMKHRPDLLKYGADRVGDAVDRITSRAGNVGHVSPDNIGKWIKQVEQHVTSNNNDIYEGSQRGDTLVTDALKIMRGSELSDAVRALKTVLGDREYNSRRGFYNFYIRQMIDMYGKQGVAEGGQVHGQPQWQPTFKPEVKPYTPGKPLPQSLQKKLDGKTNTGRAVDDKNKKA